MSHSVDSPGQGEALLRDAFQNDPRLLHDLRNHRAHDSYKLIKRLEAVKTRLYARAERDGDDGVMATIHALVSLHIQIADSIKLSRSVEKLWQPYLSSHLEHIHKAFTDHVLAMCRSDATDVQSVAKVSVLYEHNKMVQEIVRQNLATVLTWIASHLSALTQLSPLHLSQTQARCLYSFVKISLQLFQTCPLELAPAIWSQEWTSSLETPSARGRQGQDYPGSEAVGVVVQSLVHVLAVKGYNIDCTLLGGTALALLLNTAPDPETALYCFERLLGLTLSDESGFNMEFFRNLPAKPYVESMAIQMKLLDHVTIENMGFVALIRGAVVCSNTDFLCCELEISPCTKSDGDVTEGQAIETNIEAASSRNPVHIFYRLFMYIHKLCQGDITLHYHAFHILLLWYSRKCRFTSAQESSFVKAHAPSVLKSTLDLVMLNWDSPVEDVSDIVVDIFAGMMGLLTKVKETFPEFSSTILDVLLRTSWHVKGKYRVLAVLLKHLDTQQVSEVCSGVQPHLLQCLGTNHMASSASAIYKAFLTELGSNSRDAVDRWRSIWLQTVESGLVSENALLRQNMGLHWVPVTLRLLPGSASCLYGHLSGRLERGDTSVGRTRLLHAWVVVANAIRNVTGEADLTDPLIREALYSSDEGMRSEAIALICTTLKKAECLSPTEASLLKEVLPYNVKVDSAPFRQHVGSSLRKLLVRLRDSCSTMLKVPVENEQKLACALDFVDWLHRMCIIYLLPGACYQRRKGSLDLLLTLYECLIYSPDGRLRKGFTPETVVKLVDYAASKGQWSFFSRPNIEALILCLLDGSEEIQSLAFTLLTRHCHWPLEEDVEAPDSLCCHLVSEGLNLCNSPKGHESQSGAVLCKLAFQKYILLKKISVSLAKNDRNGQYVVTVRGFAGDAAIKFLRLLLQEVQRSIEEAARNWVTASKQHPVHGLVSALCQCVVASEDLLTGSRAEMASLVLGFVATCQDVIDKMLTLMSSVAGQEGCPSFAEIGMALENLISEHQSDYTETTTQSPEYQYMLAWCWNNIKESCIALGEVTSAMVSSKVVIPQTVVKGISGTFLSVLTKCRHKGVIESCRSSFIKFCSALFKSDEPSLHKIPEETVVQVLSSLKSKEMTNSVTRRSAGLPIILQAVLTCEKKLKKNVLLTLAVSELFEVCELPLADDHGVTDLPQVHGLNILDSLFGDTSLTASLMGEMGRATVLVIQLFGSPSWAIRNAATRFFSTIVMRIFGQKKTGGDVDNMLCNSVTFLEFSSFYPELPPFLLGILKEASGKDVAHISEIHPSLFPVLTLFSFLKPVDKKDEQLTRTLTEFGNQIKMFVQSPVYQLRHLVAPAFVAMVNMADLMSTTMAVIHRFIPTDSCQENIALNCIQGNLLVINKLLDYLTEQADLELVWQLMKERAWLLSVNHGMVSSLYVRILHRLMQRHRRLTEQHFLVDKMVDLCCHGEAMVGDGVFMAEVVELLFDTAVGQDEKKDLPMFIGRLLMSESLETRRACLLKIESELQNSTCSWRHSLMMSDLGLHCLLFGLHCKLLGRLLMSESLEARRACLLNIESELQNFACSWRHSLMNIMCKALQSETYAANICVILNMISKLYVEFGIILPDDMDHIRDWFKNCLPFHRKCESLLAASIPVQGILIKDILHRNTREHEAIICQWCETVVDNSKATNETRRHSAALALQIVGDSVFLAVKNGAIDLGECVVSLMSACLTLIQDEDTVIRTEACMFVSSLQWSERTVQRQSEHSNVCFELFLQYVAAQCWQLPVCVQFLCRQLYCHGNLSNVLQDKTTTRFLQLFDQEDNSFFAERLYNASSYHKALKEMTRRSSKAGRETVNEVIAEWETIMQDIGVLEEMLQSIESGSVINMTCDTSVLASICGLLLMLDMVAIVTSKPNKQTISSKVKRILQAKKLPASFQIEIEGICDLFR